MKKAVNVLLIMLLVIIGYANISYATFDGCNQNCKNQKHHCGDRLEADS